MSMKINEKLERIKFLLHTDLKSANTRERAFHFLYDI